GNFVRDLRKIFEDNKEVSTHAIEMPAGELITQVMSELRGRNLDERKETYKNLRIRDQRQWYAGKAKLNRDLARRWFVALVVVNIAALGAAILRIEFPSVDHWPTDIFVAAAASLMGWVQSKRFHELSSSYALTTHEILLLAAMMPPDNSEEKFSSFVGDAENAFSREHTQWRARRDVA
ncbi:SLATT domain-containing protein, partial [Bradyrhizobium sp. AS23.2]|uniref:SLATT domain-containing protein n=1 Tax=Bradyrhizobium sp. AS23.2 TaxID=1680155 RepID=UPI000959B49B